MGPFFAGNGFDVIDRTELSGDEAEFANAWGVADEFVFRRVLREARRSHEAGERFLSLVLTTSNHRPFTYPEGRIDIRSPGGPIMVKYTDWAIGEFTMRRAGGLLRDTVRDRRRSMREQRGRARHPDRSVPHPHAVSRPSTCAPDVAPRQSDGPGATLLGFSYRSRFFGRDILALAPEDERALLGTYQRLGYLKNGMLTVLSPVRRVDVYRIEPDGKQTPVMRRAAGDDIAEAIAYYQSASAAFSHTAQ
jgi:hypothetical protein